jgi:hypothetical protein
MQTYAGNIITGLEKNWKKNEEAQLDFIVEELKSVPAEEHEEVMYRCAAYMTLSRTAKVTDWFAEAEAEEAKADARFVAMNERDWREAQQQAKRQRWFGTWDSWVTWARRVDSKRREKASAVRVVKKEVDKVAMLLEERRDVQRYPHSYGSEEYREKLIADYEAMICAIPTGKWRLCLEKQNESKMLQPRVDEIVRQVKLTMALKETLAARRIQTAWRSRSVVDEDEDYDDGNQPPRAKDIARRTHDDGFDEYDGEDECEETDSQAAERRQEMAETAERQGETNGECCDGICCECDHGRWAEQVDPWGRTFGQAWKEFGAGIERENERVRALNAAEEEEKEKAAAAEDARREAEYSLFPGLAAFIKSCGEPCKMTMDPKLEEDLSRISHNVGSSMTEKEWQDIITGGWIGK